jgi:hypothetical protein
MKPKPNSDTEANRYGACSKEEIIDYKFSPCRSNEVRVEGLSPQYFSEICKE